MRALLVSAVVAVVVTVAAPALAQTPTVGVFFDQYFTRMDKDCPEGGGLDSAYVVANGWNMWFTAVEYQIIYPASMIWLSDLDIPPVTLGSTPTGIMEAWALPLNGWNPIVVAKILFMWNCSGCSVTDEPLVVAPYPYSGEVRAVDYPQYNIFNGVGMTSLICATVPTDDATWGRIKALYGD